MHPAMKSHYTPFEPFLSESLNRQVEAVRDYVLNYKGKKKIVLQLEEEEKLATLVKYVSTALDRWDKQAPFELGISQGQAAMLSTPLGEKVLEDMCLELRTLKRTDMYGNVVERAILYLE